MNKSQGTFSVAVDPFYAEDLRQMERAVNYRRWQFEMVEPFLQGRVLEVGPVQDVNFPWVVLGRAWLHHRLIAERNHARRESMALDAQLATHQMDSVPSELRRRLQRSFVAIRKGDDAAEVEQPLTQAIAELLGTTPQETGH